MFLLDLITQTIDDGLARHGLEQLEDAAVRVERRPGLTLALQAPGQEVFPARA